MIEVIAIVVILAILAGVALPKYFDYAAQAEESSVRGTLGGVRAGIANFYANTAIAGHPRYPTFSELETLGAVVQEPAAPNPFNGSKAIRNAEATWNVDDPPVFGAAGWAYDPANGKFWANSDTQGENAW